jgi:tetratricopeptide (TPR) repeat protein
LACYPRLTPDEAQILHQLARQVVDHDREANLNGRIALGMAQYRVGELQVALDTIRSCRELGESSVDSVFVEAMARQRLGEAEQARALYMLASTWALEPLSGAASDSIRLWREAADLLGVQRRVPTVEEVRAVVTSDMIRHVYPERLDSASDRLRRCDLWGACGYWQEAGAEMSAVIPQAPYAVELWHRRALTILARGDLPAYRTMCHEMREQFKPVVSQLRFLDQYSIHWTCMLAPGMMGNEDPSHQLASQWDQSNPGDANITLLHGLSLYRQGKNDAALERLRESQRLFEQGGPSQHQRIYALLVGAMASHRLGQLEQARDWLNSAKQAIAEEERAAVEGNAPQKLPWTRRVVLATLLREAESVLSENDTSSP